MRIFKKKDGGYLDALKDTRPELYNTINTYRTRIGKLDEGDEKVTKFDKMANQQLAATRNMPAAERDAYFKSIEKEYAKPTDDQFEKVLKQVESDKRFVPTYRYAMDQTSYGPTQGYYRNLSKEIADQQKKIDELKFTETKTRTVPTYTYYSGGQGPVGLAGSIPPTAKTTTEIPKGSTYTAGGTGGPFSTHGPGYISPEGTRYTRSGSKKITEKFERQAKAGDPEYDKAFAELGRLEKRHKYRNLYSNANKPNLTSQNVYSNLGMGSAPQGGGMGSTLYKQMTNNAMQRPPQAVGAFSKFVQPQTQPQQMNEGGEVKGKGKAVRGFKFSGVK